MLQLPVRYDSSSSGCYFEVAQKVENGLNRKINIYAKHHPKASFTLPDGVFYYIKFFLSQNTQLSPDSFRNKDISQYSTDWNGR